MVKHPSLHQISNVLQNALLHLIIIMLAVYLVSLLRRDLHTGRLNFLHRSWGPLEPFDDSFPELLKQNGTYSHIITDHHHYFADGGATYHPRYSSWELIRGQAIDRWKAHVNADIDHLTLDYHPMQHNRINYMINRQYMGEEHEYSGPQTFALGQEFLEKEPHRR